MRYQIRLLLFLSLLINLKTSKAQVCGTLDFCPIYQICVGGVIQNVNVPLNTVIVISDCKTKCMPGWYDCDGDKDAPNSNGCETPEINFQTDAANCGGCNLICVKLPFTEPKCVIGACLWDCIPGYADCNGGLPGYPGLDGCETNIRNDVDNCGRCGVKCPIASNATSICENGVCILRCFTGYEDCDADLGQEGGNGCETLILTNIDNCGGCGISCDDQDPCTIDYCVNGICVNEYKSCDDGNPCTVDICGNNGECIYAPRCPPHLTCDGSGNCIEDEAEARGVQGNSCGQSVMTGEFSGKIYLNNSYSYSKGEHDIVVARYDEMDNEIWHRTAGGKLDDRGNAVIVDDFDNLLITGYFSDTAFFDQEELASRGDKDVFVAKYSPSGELLWVKGIGSQGEDIGFGIALDYTNNVVISGYFYDGFTDGGNINLQSNGRNDIFIIKMDQNGEVIWSVSAGGAYDDAIFGLTIDKSNEVLLTGHFEGLATFGEDSYWSNGIADIFLSKVSENGEFIWTKFASGAMGDFSKAITTDKFGNVFITGDFYGDLSFQDGAVTITSDGLADFYIAKYSSTGSFQWVNNGQSEQAAEGKSLTIDTSGNVLVTGIFQGELNLASNGIHQYNSLGLRDIFIAKYSNYDGTLLWSKAEGGTDNDFSLAISNDTEGHTKYAGCYFGTSTINDVQTTALGSSDLFVTGVNDGETGVNGTYFSASLLDKSSISCGGQNNGFASISIQGGTPPYRIQWSNGDTTTSNYHLSPGLHTVQVVDSRNFSTILEVFIEESNILTINLEDKFDILCVGENTGMIEVSVRDGTPPYTFEWSNGANSSTISELSAGVYTLTVTDSAGCEESTDVEIKSAPDLYIETINLDDLICSRSNNGKISIHLEGGIPPYNILWSNGSNSPNLYDLATGFYEVTVSDSIGCSIISSYEIQEYDKLQVSAELKHPNCNASKDGSIILQVDEGLAPYNFIWSNNKTAQNLTDLDHGLYQVTITDSNNCELIDSFMLIEPEELYVDFTTIAGCGDSSIFILSDVIGGQRPYQYFWSNGKLTSSLTHVTAGEYALTIEDAVGCMTIGFIEIPDIPPLTISYIVQPVSCFGEEDGYIDLEVSGGIAPYQYAWNSEETTRKVENLSAGTYTVNILTSGNCNRAITIAIPTPTVLNVSIVTSESDLDSITAIAYPTGGTTPYNFLWNTGSTAPSISGLLEGSFSVTVTDANGCESNEEIDISLTDITEAKWLSKFQVSPNPFRNTIEVNARLHHKVQSQIRLFSVSGKVIYRESFFETDIKENIRFENISPGVYIFELSTDHGKVSHKLVKIN